MEIRCKTCDLVKTNTEYYRKSDNKNGLNSSCKDCVKKRVGVRYQRNKIAINQSRKTWRAKNKHKVKEKNDRYRHKNYEAIKKRKSEYWIESKEKLSDWYIKKTITKRTEIGASDLPKWAIDLKREEFLLTRKIKEKCETKKN